MIITKKYKGLDNEFLSSILLKHGLTREKFCKMIGMSPTLFSKKVNGWVKIYLEDLEKIKKNTPLTKSEFDKLFFCRKQS